jgi:hypothetical protein
MTKTKRKSVAQVKLPTTIPFHQLYPVGSPSVGFRLTAEQATKLATNLLTGAHAVQKKAWDYVDVFGYSETGRVTVTGNNEEVAETSGKARQARHILDRMGDTR